jgi:hypothetical protein
MPCDPKLIDWHKMGEPMPINEKLRGVRITCIMIALFGLMFLGIGITAGDLAFVAMGLLFIGSSFTILINWIVIKKDYVKNYKKNLQQWKKTKKYNTGRN